MKILLSMILGFLLTQFNAQANSGNKVEKVKHLQDKVEVLYDELELKASTVLPPLKKLNVRAMSIDDLVEIQKILAPFHVLDKKLSSYPRLLRRPLSQQNLPKIEKELGHLKEVIKRL